MWLIKVIDFLYFREGKKAFDSDHAFSILEKLEHTQFKTIAKQQFEILYHITRKGSYLESVSNVFGNF